MQYMHVLSFACFLNLAATTEGSKYVQGHGHVLSDR